MAMDPQLKAQLRQTIYYAVPDLITADGSRSYGSATSCSARVEELSRRVLGPDGEERLSSHHIVVDSTTTLGMGYRIWLPGVSTTQANARTPLSVAKAVDEYGNTSHWEVFV